MVLTLKLLSAAEHAYAIAGDGPVAAKGAGSAAPASGHVGWLPGWPVGWAQGPGDHNAGLVGRIREGVVVALRGTRIPEPTLGMTLRQILGDWLIDLDFPLGHGAPYAGQVHTGFSEGVRVLWPELLADIRRAVVEADAARDTAGLPGLSPIFVTGHSKGGGMAPLVAWRLRDEFAAPRQIVVRTFAAPNMADGAFEAAYIPRVTQHVRYECSGDAIPHLPFADTFFGRLPALVSAWLAALRRNTGYEPLGALSYIRPDGVVVGDSDAVGRDRRDAFVTALGTGVALAAKDRHLLDAGGGYCTAAYQPCAWTT